MGVTNNASAFTANGSSNTSLVNGTIEGIIVDLGTGVTSVDVDITPSLHTGFHILTVTSVTSDTHYIPLKKAVWYDGSDADLSDAQGGNIYTPSKWTVNDLLTITIANFTGSGTVTVKVIYRT